MGKKKGVSSMLLDVAKNALRRLVDAPAPSFTQGDRCTVRYSLVAETGGTLLRGTLVEMTGVQDPKGRYQIRVLEIPDYQWTETNRLPYGPGFVLFVDDKALEPIDHP
ncbi:MAG: hypothetical protein AB7L09_00525 [Nitrospira sp.]